MSAQNIQSIFLTLDLSDLLDAEGMEGLNTVLDDTLLLNGVRGIASDIDYKVVGTDNGSIVIEATYTLEGLEEDYDDDDSNG